MLVLAACVIGFLVLAGIANVIYVWRGLVVPIPLAVTHGVAALAGVTLLGFAAAAETVIRPVNAGLVFLVLTAIGGLLLLSLRPGGRPQPLLLAIFHGILGMTGFALVLIGLFSH